MHFTPADRRWNWIDDGVLPYALAAMRALWIWLLLRLWGESGALAGVETLGWLTVFGLLALSTLVTQFAALRARSTWRATLLVSLTGLIAVGAAFCHALGRGSASWTSLDWLHAILAPTPLAVVTALVAVWLWWWGVLTGRSTVGYDVYARNFAFGVAALAIAVGAASVTEQIPLPNLILPLLSFFALSLATLAIAGVQSTRRFERHGGNQLPAFNRTWLGTVAVVIGGLLLAGLLFMQLFTPDVARQILAGLNLLLSLLARLLYWVLYAVVWLLLIPIEYLVRLLRAKNRAAIEIEIAPPPTLGDLLGNAQQAGVRILPGVFLVLRGLAGVLVVALILALFTWAFRRFRTYFEEDVEEVRDSVLSRDVLRAQLSQILSRLAGRRSAQGEPYATVVGHDARAQVRRVYQALLAWATAQDVPRPPGITPREYARLLGETWPAWREPIAVITAAYQQARYGQGPLTAACAEETARAWARILQDSQEGSQGSLPQSS